MPMPNMRDIAAKAGVSVSTVSAVLNGNKYVSPSLQRKVEAAAAEMEYAVRQHGEMPRPSSGVAVILPGVYSVFFPPLLSGIEDVAMENHFLPVLCDTNRRIESEYKALKSCVASGIKHVILDSVCDVEHEAAYFGEIRREMIEKHGVSVVLLEREMKDEAFHSIYVDNYHSSYLVTEHLIERGCTKIAHIRGSHEFPHTMVRAQGYLDALRDHDIPFDKQLMQYGDFSTSSGHRVVSEMFTKGVKFDAISAANDQMAIAAMKVLLQHGLRIPEDVAVAGFDNLVLASMVTPSLTTVQYPVYQMGYRAMQMMVDSARGEEGPRKVQLETKLMIRQSTDPSQIPDWDLQFW
jgi:DNA-binding LacI/PurR family transcriptional regulator